MSDSLVEDFRTLIFGAIELVLRVVLYLLHSLLMWSKQTRIVASSSKKAKPGDASYQLLEPPDHVRDAMERFKQRQSGE